MRDVRYRAQKFHPVPGQLHFYSDPDGIAEINDQMLVAKMTNKELRCCRYLLALPSRSLPRYMHRTSLTRASQQRALGNQPCSTRLLPHNSAIHGICPNLSTFDKHQQSTSGPAIEGRRSDINKSNSRTCHLLSIIHWAFMVSQNLRCCSPPSYICFPPRHAEVQATLCAKLELDSATVRHTPTTSPCSPR